MCYLFLHTLTLILLDVKIANTKRLFLRYPKIVKKELKRDKFSRKQCPNNDLEGNKTQKNSYASIVRSLIYTQVCTHLDISLSIHLSDPIMQHWKIVKYIANTPHMDISICWIEELFLGSSVLKLKLVINSVG
ncbi:hypothetical protein CR513_02610, partial [Mucuna pruriens]